MEYLGHIISQSGVVTDLNKFEAMVNWPFPKTLKSLKGFLGLTGYYRKFIKDYGRISKPLTNLLRKGNFKWDEKATLAFEELKDAMTKAPVLAMPNFKNPFILETDAYDSRLGAVLVQEGRAIAFMSKALGVKTQGLSTYEKEYLALLIVVKQWRHYLELGTFVIRTDHELLMYLLDQRITNQIQKKGLRKLMGLSFRCTMGKGEKTRQQTPYLGAGKIWSYVLSPRLR